MPPSQTSSAAPPREHSWLAIGKGYGNPTFRLSCDKYRENVKPNVQRLQNAARKSSLGMGFRGFWQILARFWGFERAKEGSVEVSEVSGDRSVWRGREAVVKEACGEEIVGCREGGAGEEQRVVEGGCSVGNRVVGREERAVSGGLVERVGGGCRDSVFGVASEFVEKRGGAVENVGGGELPGRVLSRLGGDVVTVGAGKLAGGSGQHQPRGRRPEVHLYDSLESCLKQRSLLEGSRSCGVGVEGLVRDHGLPAHEIGSHVSQKDLEEFSSRKRESRSVESSEPGGRDHGRSRSSQRIEQWVERWRLWSRYGSGHGSSSRRRLRDRHGGGQRRSQRQLGRSRRGGGRGVGLGGRRLSVGGRRWT